MLRSPHAFRDRPRRICLAWAGLPARAHPRRAAVAAAAVLLLVVGIEVAGVTATARPPRDEAGPSSSAAAAAGSARSLGGARIGERLGRGSAAADRAVSGELAARLLPRPGGWRSATSTGRSATLQGLHAGPVAAEATPSGTSLSPPTAARALASTTIDARSLAVAFAKARGLAAGSIGGVRPGSVRVAAVVSTGVDWAVASYSPTAGVALAQQVAFQDGAGTAIFSRAPGSSWRVVAPGAEPLACDSVLPAAVRAAWRLDTGICRAAVPAGSSGGRTGGVTASGVVAPQSVAGSATLGADIAAVALSQVNHNDVPAVTNFNGVDCDPYTPMVGPAYPNADARGCGYDSTFGVENENEEWCADFAEWVWLHSGVTTDMNLINPGANSFYSWGKAQGQALSVDPSDPQVGDAVVFYPPGTISTTTGADHVGIITAVNPDGTVNMVNGDFLGSTNIGVQYDPNLDLGPWSSSVWGSGEQWVFVTPPSGVQPADPVVSVSAPRLVAADTQTFFQASATEPGGAIAGYAWAFGDGSYVPGGTAAGPTVRHVFADPGRVTVSLTVRSTAGTITVKTMTLDVLASSSTALSTPSDALYYSYTPVRQRVFISRASGGLVEQSWDGASWLDESLPGGIVAGGQVAALNYKDAQDVLTPHVFGATSAGDLEEISLANGRWTAALLPGSPASGSPIVAMSMPSLHGGGPSYPAVFYDDTAGFLAETAAPDGQWTTSQLPAAATPAGALAAGTVADSAGPVPAVWSLGRNGSLVLSTFGDWGWASQSVPSPVGVAADSPLAAVNSAGAGQPAVYYVDSTGDLAELNPTGTPLAPAPTSPLPPVIGVLGGASSPSGGLAFQGVLGGAGRTPGGRFPPGALHDLGQLIVPPAPPSFQWAGQQVSTTPVALTGGLAALNALPAGGAPVHEVVALATSHSPVLVTDTAGTWATKVLPGTATGLAGLAAYPVPGAGQRLVLTGSDGFTVDTDAGDAGTWVNAALPGTPTSFAGRVLLYAAESTDGQSALAAARAAGLPSTQVTEEFATAWSDALSGDYLVIAVGAPATDALYFNACGWANPSNAYTGSTPFNLAGPPLDQLPGAGNFEEAAGATASASAALATDLATYAVEGHYPSGVTSPPAEVAPAFVCAGQPTPS